MEKSVLHFLSSEHIPLLCIPAGVSLAASDPQPVIPKLLYRCCSRVRRLTFVCEHHTLLKACHHWEECKTMVASAVKHLLYW